MPQDGAKLEDEGWGEDASGGSGEEVLDLTKTCKWWRRTRKRRVVGATRKEVET